MNFTRSFTRAFLPAAALLLPLAAQASSLVTFHAFHNKGRYAYGGLVHVGTRLLGTSSAGGTSNLGTVYRLTLTNGAAEQVFQNFTGGNDGKVPFDTLIRVGSLLYGTTQSGGANGVGTVFHVGTNGSNFTTIHTFTGGATDGGNPSAGLIYYGGNLYGTTQGGGASGLGTVFRMDTSGNITVLHSFGGNPDGASPYQGLLRIGQFLYGSTENGGTSGQGMGTVFKIKATGTNYQILHTFTGGSGDGQEPRSALTSFGGGVFGTTKVGGASNLGTVFRVDTTGSNYAMLYSFAGGAGDGAQPFGTLLPVFVNAGQPGALYGTTASGGTANQGTVYKIDVNGVEAMLYAFTGGNDGAVPQSEMLEVNGLLYGTTSNGGAWGRGTVFEFTP
jgi:uncharacterized repeat protein (TIGR03803 family)